MGATGKRVRNGRVMNYLWQWCKVRWLSKGPGGGEGIGEGLATLALSPLSVLQHG